MNNPDEELCRRQARLKLDRTSKMLSARRIVRDTPTQRRLHANGA